MSRMITPMRRRELRAELRQHQVGEPPVVRLNMQQHGRLMVFVAIIAAIVASITVLLWALVSTADLV
jgi:hypothetical protein